MKKISKKDSLRILNHIKKARAIIDGIIEDENGEGVTMSEIGIAEDCESAIGEILIAINNTIYG